MGSPLAAPLSPCRHGIHREINWAHTDVRGYLRGCIEKVDIFGYIRMTRLQYGEETANGRVAHTQQKDNTNYDAQKTDDTNYGACCLASFDLCLRVHVGAQGWGNKPFHNQIACQCHLLKLPAQLHTDLCVLSVPGPRFARWRPRS